VRRLSRLLLVAWLLGPAAAAADPVRVRLPEGNARGFLVLQTLEGEPIAHGELGQKPSGGAIESVLTLRFKDGSVREETTVYSQRQVFRVEAYRLVQRGPSFPTMEVAFDRKSGRYTARVQEKKDGKEESASGPMEMPADLYNGLALLLLKNLPSPAGVSVRLAVFLPKPRLIRMELGPEGEERVLAGGETRKATRYLVKLEVGGLTGLLASLVGKDPPDLRYWLVDGPVPAFARFQGAMFLNGPVWRLEFAPVEWPR
jgi:hypothetical protein